MDRETVREFLFQLRDTIRAEREHAKALDLGRHDRRCQAQGYPAPGPPFGGHAFIPMTSNLPERFVRKTGVTPFSSVQP